MPIYEYECQKCGSHLEVIQKITDSPLKSCQNKDCKGKLHRLISNSSFILKGSGWYVTDYPSEARKNGMNNEKKATSPKESNGKQTSGSKTSTNGKKSPKTGQPQSKTTVSNK